MNRKILFLTAAMAFTFGKYSMADDYKNNPFTLTYAGAITQNESGKVNIHPARYTQKQTGIEIAANVYTPADYDPEKNIRPLSSPIPMAASKNRSPDCTHNNWQKRLYHHCLRCRLSGRKRWRTTLYRQAAKPD